MTTRPATMTELDFRVNDGIQVSLLWDSATDELRVAVVDTKLGDAFDVLVQPDQRPLDVFHHPFAYANRAIEPGLVEARR